MSLVGVFSELVELILVFFICLSLSFWWISFSTSISLLMVLLFSVFSVVYFSFFLEFKIPLFLIVLTLSGGLFVLIAFVVLSHPSDHKTQIVSSKMTYFFYLSFFFVFFYFLFFLDKKKFVLCPLGLFFSDQDMKVWGNFFFVYVFLIFILFIFLFSVNSILNPSTGGMFSSKKGKMMG